MDTESSRDAAFWLSLGAFWVIAISPPFLFMETVFRFSPHCQPITRADNLT
jgi:hypothetical protein